MSQKFHVKWQGESVNYPVLRKTNFCFQGAPTMTSPIAARIPTEGSLTRKYAALGAKAAKEAGIDLIPMNLGEPSDGLPESMKQAMIDALDRNDTHYTPGVGGTPAFKQAVAGDFAKTYGLSYNPATQVLGAPGAADALFSLFGALVNPGEKVVMPTPGWLTVQQMAQFFGADVHTISCGGEHGYKLTGDKLAELDAALEGAKVFYLNNPCNPTGELYSREELEALAAVLNNHPDVQIISDDIYHHLTRGQEFVSLLHIDPSFADRMVVVDGLSKAWNGTGLRVAYMAGPEEIMSAASTLLSIHTPQPGTPEQAATVAILTNPDMDFLAEQAESYARRFQIVMGALRNVEAHALETGFLTQSQYDARRAQDDKARGGFYVWWDASPFNGLINPMTGETIKNAADSFLYLAAKGVGLTPGVAFDGTEVGENHLRLSYGGEDSKLIDASARMEAALKELLDYNRAG
jgi:aspartate aminotransferase